MLNAMIHAVIDEGLVDADFIARSHAATSRRCARTSRATARKRWRRSAASRPRPCAKWRAPSPPAKGAMILWGMGISQHVHGTDNARCLIALSLITGQIGKPGTGLHPLRGQNNVQGATRRRPDPDDVPQLPARRQRRRAGVVRELLGLAPDSSTTSPATRWSRSCKAHRCRPRSKRHVHHGREPGDERPRPDHARDALATLEHLVVQDIFMTETA